MQQSEGRHMPRAAVRQFEKAVVQSGLASRREAVGRTGQPFVKTGQITTEVRRRKKL